MGHLTRDWRSAPQLWTTDRRADAGRSGERVAAPSESSDWHLLPFVSAAALSGAVRVQEGRSRTAQDDLITWAPVHSRRVHALVPAPVAHDQTSRVARYLTRGFCAPDVFQHRAHGWHSGHRDGNDCQDRDGLKLLELRPATVLKNAILHASMLAVPSRGPDVTRNTALNLGQLGK